MTFKRPSPVVFKALQGSFTQPADIGAYAVNLTVSGSRTFLYDPSAPASGTGYWYLVKPGGCVRSSWQTVLGAEPGRDTAIP